MVVVCTMHHVHIVLINKIVQMFECYIFTVAGNPFAKCVGSFFVFFSMFLMIITFPLSLVVCIRMVSEYQRAVVFRLGRIRFANWINKQPDFKMHRFEILLTRMGKARGPGLIFILPCVDVIRVVDLRTTTCVVPPQDILTKDSVTVSVDAVVFHRVRDPLNAVVKVGFQDILVNLKQV